MSDIIIKCIDELIHEDKHERIHEVELHIPQRALRLLGHALMIKGEVPVEKLNELLRLMGSSSLEPFHNEKYAIRALNYYVKDKPVIEIDPDDDQFTIDFFLNHLPCESVEEEGLWKCDLSFLEAYSCRPKFSKYGGTIWFDHNNIKSIEYGGIKLDSEDKGDQWNYFKFILRSSAICYIILLNFEPDKFVNRLLFMTFGFTKDSWKLLLEDLAKKPKIPNNINISYFANPKFAGSRYYYNGKNLWISAEGQQLLLFTQLL